MTRRLRPSRLPLLAAGVLLTAPLLGGCGFDYATDRVNTISAGINNRDDAVNVLGAVVVANQDGAGVFAATLVNADRETEAVLESVTLDGQEFPVTAGEDSTVPPAGRVSMLRTGGVQVEGDFKAGEFVDVALSFDTGQLTEMEVNVVSACRQYSPERLPELDLPPAPTDTEAGSEPSEEPSVPSEDTTEESQESTDESAETGAEGEEAGEESAAEGEQLPDAYSCESIPPVDHHAE